MTIIRIIDGREFGKHSRNIFCATHSNSCLEGWLVQTASVIAGSFALAAAHAAGMNSLIRVIGPPAGGGTSLLGQSPTCREAGCPRRQREEDELAHAKERWLRRRPQPRSAGARGGRLTAFRLLELPRRWPPTRALLACHSVLVTLYLRSIYVPLTFYTSSSRLTASS